MELDLFTCPNGPEERGVRLQVMEIVEVYIGLKHGLAAVSLASKKNTLCTWKIWRRKVTFKFRLDTCEMTPWIISVVY